MTINDVFREICENPEDDEARLEYARQIESADPAHAKLIRLQIDTAVARRRGESVVDGDEPRRLLAAHSARWSRDLAKFAPRGDPELVEFYRGFPVGMKIDPRLFAEYADLLFRLAPLRHIRFRSPLDDDGRVILLPDNEPVGCPQLARLDSIAFDKVNFKRSPPRDDGGARGPGDIRLLAACPHLTRCVLLNFGRSFVSENEFVELAEGALTGKMLTIEPEAIGERRAWTHDERGREAEETLFDERWRELERRLGYVPWMHPSQNRAWAYDARWMFEHGKLPKYPAGSPPRPEWYNVPLIYKRGVGW